MLSLRKVYFLSIRLHPKTNENDYIELSRFHSGTTEIHGKFQGNSVPIQLLMYNNPRTASRERFRFRGIRSLTGKRALMSSFNGY